MEVTTMRKPILIAAATTVAAAAGVAYAAIPNSNGVVSACYAKAGDLRVIDAEAGGQCKSGETALSWSRQGPKGDAGPQGPAGPAGPAGPKGDRGPSNGFFVRRDGQVITVPHDDFGAVDGINLPAGSFLLFGTARFAQAPSATATSVECIMVDPKNGFYVTRALAQLAPGHSTDELTLAGSLTLDQATTVDVLCKAGAAGVTHDQLKLDAIEVGSLTGGGYVPVDP
jgi:hypothetical protein